MSVWPEEVTLEDFIGNQPEKYGLIKSGLTAQTASGSDNSQRAGAFPEVTVVEIQNAEGYFISGKVTTASPGYAESISGNLKIELDGVPFVVCNSNATETSTKESGLSVDSTKPFISEFDGTVNVGETKTINYYPRFKQSFKAVLNGSKWNSQSSTGYGRGTASASVSYALVNGQKESGNPKI